MLYCIADAPSMLNSRWQLVSSASQCMSGVAVTLSPVTFFSSSEF